MYVVMSKLKDRISTDNKHMIKYIMRKIVLSLFALCCFSAVMAQQKTRNLSVELLGAQNIVGINYDSRFEGNSGLGYRVGIGYGYGDNSGFLFDQKINGVGVPLELNYLLGKKNSKLELGFGASLGVYQVKETIGYVKDTGRYPGGENTDETSPKIDFTLHQKLISVISSSATSAIAISASTDSCFVLAYRHPSISETSMDSKRQPSFHISV